MPLRLEDYALIGDARTAGLVGRDGSLDWLCLPRFDAGACFAALLGEPEHGRWLLAPAAGVRAAERRYRHGTLVLESDFETEDGDVRVIDCMLRRDELDQYPRVVRVVEGRRGRVPMRMELIIRFDYGSLVPWVRKIEDGAARLAVGGPDALVLRAGVEVYGENLTTVAEFFVDEGVRVPFTLTWHPSHEPPPSDLDAERAVRDTEVWWQDWSARCRYVGEWEQPVRRSLITLKALTYEPTGGIVAAPTTSLPEQLRGQRNWDYRYCWLRDATLTLQALMFAGYADEARAWRDWLVRAVAGSHARWQIMYGPAGERRLSESELCWLPGYEGSAPVRIGNGAARQFQLDVYGEVLDALHQARLAGIASEEAAWRLERAMVTALEQRWREPDEGIWEVRGPKRHFTHSKVMAWVAVDRGIKAIEQFGLNGPLERWHRLRAEIHAQVLREGYNEDRQAFTQSLGSIELDASLLLLPLVGFLPSTDRRVRNTVAAIERELIVDGLVMRYASSTEQESVDGLPAGEGAFLPCSFWMADNLALLGRHADARHLYERLLSLQNDVGLLAEEYDTSAHRLVGNFPQAFSHIGLVNTAYKLGRQEGAPTLLPA